MGHFWWKFSERRLFAGFVRTRRKVKNCPAVAKVSSPLQIVMIIIKLLVALRWLFIPFFFGVTSVCKHQFKTKFTLEYLVFV